MPRNERWGRPYPDKRDWSIYNERLVRRGEFYLSLAFIDQWDELLARMNAGNRGRSFQYPEPFIAWMASPELLAEDVIFADSTAVKVTNRGEWMRERNGESGEVGSRSMP